MRISPIGQLSKGFTLVEVLVALSICIIGIAAAQYSISQSILVFERLDDKTLEIIEGRNIIEELKIKKQWPDLGVIKGTTKISGRVMYWERIIEETPDVYVKKVTVRVGVAKDREGTEAVGFLVKNDS